METMFKSAASSPIISFLLILISLFSTVIMSIAIASALVVPLTFAWGLISGQSYDRVCDNSEFIYRLNMIGKWTWVIAIGLFIMYLIYIF